MKKLLFPACLLFATAATAQNAVVSTKDKETNSKDEVVASYYLPKMVLEIEVEAINNKFVAGPYASDARQYFGTSADTQDKNAWEVTNVRIKQRSEPDPAQHYKVYAAYGSAGSLISLTSNEILRGVNLSMDLDAKMRKDGLEKYHSQSNGKGKHRQRAEKQKNNDFKMNFKYKENDSTPEVANAKFAYDLINNLRRTRADILQQNGDDVKDVEAYLVSIEKEEKDLSALFFGKTTKEKSRMTFSFNPDKEGASQEVCKFSSRNGFSETSEAITVTIKKKSSTSKVSNTSGKSGYIYRVPAMAEVEIKQGKTTLWKGTLAIPQLGTTESLPAGFFDKNDLKALFDSETGALLRISK